MIVSLIILYTFLHIYDYTKVDRSVIQNVSSCAFGILLLCICSKIQVNENCLNILSDISYEMYLYQALSRKIVLRYFDGYFASALFVIIVDIILAFIFCRIDKYLEVKANIIISRKVTKRNAI